MIWWPPFIYCKVNKPRAKYLVIVDFWDALLISRAQSTRMVFDKKSNLDQLNWPDLQNHSEWGGGGGISESIHIFGVKYPGCQIIWQVTRASLFTARPSATVKALQAFADRHRLKLLHSQIVLVDLRPLSWEVNTASFCVKHLWQNSWLYIWSSTVGGPKRATAVHFHKMNLMRPKHLHTLPTDKRLRAERYFAILSLMELSKCHGSDYQGSKLLWK